MQALDLHCKPPLDPSVPDPSVMSERKSSPIRSSNAENSEALVESSSKSESNGRKNNWSKNNGDSSSNNVVVKRERPSRACTQRAAERMQAAARAEAEMEAERKRKRGTRKQKLAARLLKEDSEFDDEEEGSDDVRDEDNADEDDGEARASSTITPLVGDLEDSQLPRWNIRSMWQLASIFNFLNVFRPLLNINVEFSAEELETALLTPNNTLADIHIPLLKAIPPIIRMAHGPTTWITVLCRKLRDWWHWVAEGDLPIVASHGAEIEAYNSLEPGVRVVILKALCDIRVEQEDIKIFIDDSIKNGAQLSLFRKQRIGGDSRGVSYWYEEDPIIGHRLYREIRKVEVKRGKGKSVPQTPHSSYQWEAIATNLDEFVNVSEKLFASKNRTEVSVGKKLKNDMIPEIEKVHKKKERLLKKQHREALMLDSIMHIDGLGGGSGRSLRDRKPVTYTFDDFDRSINEALKFTKNRQQSPEPHERGDQPLRTENSLNGGWAGTLRSTRQDTFSAPSPMSYEEDGMLEDHEAEIFDEQKDEALDRGNRRRQRPQRYAENNFTDGISDNEADLESDDDIVGEVVYDEEYLRKRKRRRKASSSEEGDEEYKWDEEENPEEEEDEDEDEDDNSLSTSEEDSDEQPRKSRGRTRRGTRLRSAKEKTQTGLRRSKRSTRNRVNYKLYEMSESDNELMKPGKSAAEQFDDASGNDEDEEDPYSFDGMQDFDEGKIDEHEHEETNMEVPVDQPTEENNKPVETVDGNKEETDYENPTYSFGDDQEDDEGLGKRRFLDLNELAPGTGFDDGPNSTRDDDDDPSGF